MVNNRGMDKNADAPWSQLHWLIVLAEQGSYTSAAARLSVSKASMSQHIAELERAVGQTLVRRSTRSMQLTEAGRLLVEETRGSFDKITQSFHNARDTDGEPRGLIRVTAPVALGRQHLVPRIAQFLLAHPAIRIELDLSDRLSSLALDGFDLAVRHAGAAPETHVAVPLCKTDSVLVASPGYLQAYGVPETPEALASHACLHYPRGREKNVWSFERRDDRSRTRAAIHVPIGGAFTANNSEALRDAAHAGVGIALVPDFSAHAALKAGDLVEVLSDWRPLGAFADQIFAMRPYSAHPPRAVALFVKHLKKELAGGFRVR